METLQRYSDRYAFPKFFITVQYTHIQMLCHAHIRQLIRSVSAGTTRCCLVFNGYGSSRKDKEQLYSTCGVSSNSFLNGSYLILLLIFSSIHWAGVGKWIEIISPFAAGFQWLLVELETLISCNCIAGDCSWNNCSCFKNNVKCVLWQAITLTMNLSSLFIIFSTCRYTMRSFQSLYINYVYHICRFIKLQNSFTIFMMFLPFQGVFLNDQFRLFIYFLLLFREHAYEFYY